MSPEPVLVLLHGANLNLLGERPVEHYGTVTLRELEDMVTQEAQGHGWRCVCHQTNHEGDFIDLVQRYRHADAMILNPGAWTHYSYAIRDAVELVEGPVAEVHLSAVAEREEWRRRSVLEGLTAITVAGLGPAGYVVAVHKLAELLNAREPRSKEGSAD